MSWAIGIHPALRIGAAVVLLAACDPSVDRPEDTNPGGPGPAGPPPPSPPDAPMFATQNMPPGLTPFPIVALQGAVRNGDRVFFEGIAKGPISVLALPGGSFCYNATLPAPGRYTITAYALRDEVGLVSPRSAPFEITYDPQSLPPMNEQELLQRFVLCGGQRPESCASFEDCADGTDNDCNGLADGRDPACGACIDDVLEDNDDPGAALIEPGLEQDLQICPDDPDRYGVLLEPGEAVVATIRLQHAEGDLNLQLLDERGAVLDRSETTFDEEAVTFTNSSSAAARRIEVFVFGTEIDTANRYSLELSVGRP